MADCTGLTDCALYLCQAKNAYHELMTTGRAVRVMHADGEVEYHKIKSADLKNYIKELEFECGDCADRTPIRFGW